MKRRKAGIELGQRCGFWNHGVTVCLPIAAYGNLLFISSLTPLPAGPPHLTDLADWYASSRAAG
eukprot:1997774-Rhodomonas_salina.2